MKNFTYLLIGITLLLLLGACSGGLKIQSEYNEEADFSQYTTYGLLRPGDMTGGYPVSMDPERQQILENAIIKEMEDRGYKWSQDPQLQVAYYVKVAEDTRYSSMNFYGGAGSYLGPGYWGFYPGYSYGWSNIEAITHKEGSLIIDVADLGTNELVWYSYATQALEDKTGVPIDLQLTVKTIFANYPTSAGQQVVKKK